MCNWRKIETISFQSQIKSLKQQENVSKALNNLVKEIKGFKGLVIHRTRTTNIIQTLIKIYF